MDESARRARSGAFAGLGLLAWYTNPATAASHGYSADRVAEGGDLDAIAARYRRTGAAWLAVKTGDYGTTWHNQILDLIALRQRGVNCYAWVYCRHDDPAAEVALILDALRAGGAVILDTEQEVEGKAAAAEEILAKVRERAPSSPIAYAPLPVIKYHLALPYVQYNQFCDAVLPQFYVQGLGADRYPIADLIAQWAEWSDRWRGAGGLVPPIYPLVESYAPEPLLIDIWDAVRERFGGVAYWEWSQTTPAGWRVIAAAGYYHAAARSAASQTADRAAIDPAGAGAPGAPDRPAGEAALVSPPDAPLPAPPERESLRIQLDSIWGQTEATRASIAALKDALGLT